MERSADDSYRGPTLSITVGRGGSRVHRLIDDTTNYTPRASKITIRRDPMVEALFGAARVLVGKATPPLPKKV